MPALTPFDKHTSGLDSPPRHLALVTAADSDLTTACRAIAFTTAGDIKVTTVGGETLVLPSGAFAAGVWHGMELTRIWASATTASGFVVGW